MYETAGFMGVDPAFILDMTPRMFSHYSQGYKEQIEIDTKKVDAQNHSLGMYIAIAINAPKEYPDKPYLSEQQETTKQPHEMSPEMIELTLDRWVAAT